MKEIKALAVVGFVALSGIGAWKSQELSSKQQNSDTVFLENVEALSDDTEESQVCTRMINSEPCYEWVNMGYYPNTTTPIMVRMITHYRITAIEEYTPKSDVEICSHDQITDC